MRCSFEKKSWEKICLDSCVDFKNAKEIFFFRHLGSGETGDCCLALTNDGRQCCAVKFFLIQNRPSRLELANVESANWHKVYGQDAKLPKCHVGKLPNDDFYLCMPYLRPIPKSERQTLIGKDGKVEAALLRFATSGYKHNDVCWQHLGWWQKELYLFDLGDTSECGEQDRQKWVDETRRRLEGQAKMPLSTVHADIDKVPSPEIITSSGVEDQSLTQVESNEDRNARQKRRRMT
jgi:hypothetical protein